MNLVKSKPHYQANQATQFQASRKERPLEMSTFGFSLFLFVRTRLFPKTYKSNSNQFCCEQLNGVVGLKIHVMGFQTSLCRCNKIWWFVQWICVKTSNECCCCLVPFDVMIDMMKEMKTEVESVQRLVVLFVTATLHLQWFRKQFSIKLVQIGFHPLSPSKEQL